MGLVLDSLICPLSFMSLTGWHMIILASCRYVVFLSSLTHILIFHTVMLGFLLLLSAQEKTWP